MKYVEDKMTKEHNDLIDRKIRRCNYVLRRLKGHSEEKARLKKEVKRLEFEYLI